MTKSAEAPGNAFPDRGPANPTAEPGAADPGRVWSKDDPVATTVPATESGKTYTQADVEQAWKDAPRDAAGNPVDHRTGHPLVETRADGERGWHMTWDPDNGVWMAERPGTGYPAPGAMPERGVPNSFGYDADGNLMRYANDRPAYAPGQVEAVWDKAPKLTDEHGKQYVLLQDAQGAPVKVYWEPGQPRQGLWDMGHARGEEYRRLREDYLSHKMTEADFLARYQDPSFYEVAHPGRNRSHIDEF